MGGQQGKKISTRVIVCGLVVVLIALYFAGHNSAHVDSPATVANSPTPTNPSNIKDWNKQPVVPLSTGKTPAQQAEEAYAAQQQVAAGQNLAYASAALC